MEFLNKVSEIKDNIKETINEKGFDPDKRLDIQNDSSDTKGKESFNPDKRLENQNEVPDTKKSGIFDPDSRLGQLFEAAKDKIQDLINPEKREMVNELIDKYADQLQDKVEYPEFLNNQMEYKNLDKPVSTKESRKEFQGNKEKLITKWEEMTGKEWPRYTENVYSEKGVLIRKAGDRYDAHHNWPLFLGGKNEASNISPIHVNAHKELHAKEAPLTQIKKIMEGKSV